MNELRTIENRRAFNAKRFFLQWEWLLLLVFIGINIMNTSLSPYYLNPSSILDATMNFNDKAFMVLAMTFVIIIGEIDISVGSTVALSSVMMSLAYNAGMPMVLALILCIAVGTLCGAINGMLAIKFPELPPMIITLSTMTIFRGLAYVLLENRSSGGFPDFYANFSWGYLFGIIPISLVTFAFFAVIFYLVLHKSQFGRELYAMGANMTTARFSGIKTEKNRFLVYTIMGFMAGICAVFLTSRMGSTRPNVALGYELEVIAMVVLGGVATTGGIGKMSGVLLSIFIIGFLRYGLGLLNVDAQLVLIIIGGLLIFSVLASNMILKNQKRRVKKVPAQNE